MVRRTRFEFSPSRADAFFPARASRLPPPPSDKFPLSPIEIAAWTIPIAPSETLIDGEAHLLRRDHSGRQRSHLAAICLARRPRLRSHPRASLSRGKQESLEISITGFGH